ncbi:MAG: carbon-nitrogen hydrolase family protein [Nitrososphaerota archaeon]
MRSIRVAAVQLTPSTVSESLEKAVEFIKLARDGGASVVCLPEAWFHRTPLAYIDAMLSSYETILGRLSESAANNKVWVVGGGLYSPDGPSVVAPIISPDGDIIGLQEKVHLFRGERLVFRHGKRFKVFDMDGVKAGILVCHDIVYPEAARTLALRGAELAFNPSRIVWEGCAPWRRYLEVRCLENRMPLVAPNIILPDLYGGLSTILTVGETAGRVGVVETLAEARDVEQVLVAEIDLEKPAIMRVDRLSGRVPEAYEGMT